MIWRSIWLICCLLIIHSPFALSANQNMTTRVLFVNPGFADESFWGDVDGYAQAAASSLGLTLEILHGNRDHILTQQLLAKRMQVLPKPDYVVLVNEKSNGLALLNMLSESNCFVSFVLNDLSPSSKQTLRTDPIWNTRLMPGVFPNNFNIGYLTAKDLYQKGKDKQGAFLILSGDKNTPASNNREAGAMAFVMQQEHTTVAQRVYGDWREDLAYEQTKVLLKRHSKVRYIWTANDHMAFGAQKAISEAGRSIGNDIFISTINTSQSVLSELKDGHITSLGGGHFTAVGLQMVKIHHHQKDQRWPQRTKFNLFQIIRYPSELFSTLEGKAWSNIDFENIDIFANPIDPFVVKSE
ncbi:ABC transporter substrate-binding protein [Vibrio mediterranei]|uniref:ABC transporter substrate-binding protein n=1 Tax=Vibrio mediterranei TaxID=689 RepID=UPI0022848A0D|nr:ABC transporter substrate-binding protein [Vibrio mediterranei]MCY9853115.1 ABC transporter substrate-binding protein [Vibrio mediterranei]